jgi:predicted nuclease of predicted toxin-antitoxin system
MTLCICASRVCKGYRNDGILVKSRTEARILLTVDLDFAQLLAMSGEALPSVILFRLGNKNY